MAAVIRTLPFLGRNIVHNVVFNGIKNTLRVSSSVVTTHSTIEQKSDGSWGNAKVDEWVNWYENFVGLTEVRAAQTKVIEAQHVFQDLTDKRQVVQQQTSSVHAQLRALKADLDKTHRGDERFLQLLTEEHKVIKEEFRLSEHLSDLEKRERNAFAALSWAVRESHEKERARTERTKYWSIIGSVIGALIGILGTSINNYLRMRELRGIVVESAEGGVQMKGLVGQLSDTMKNQHNQIQGFIGDLKLLIGVSPSDIDKDTSLVKAAVEPDASLDQFEVKTKEILDVVTAQDVAIEREMQEIKKILGTSRAMDTDGNVIYVGPEVQILLDNTERNLEYKMKVNALWTVACVYGAVAVTIPLLMKYLGGN